MLRLKKHGSQGCERCSQGLRSQLDRWVLTTRPLHRWRSPKYKLSVCREARTKRWTVVAGSSKGFEDTGTVFETEKEAREVVGGAR